MKELKIELGTCVPAAPDSEPLVDFFGKYRFRPTEGIMGTFNGQPVSLETSLQRDWVIGPNFERPNVSTRAELAEWLTGKGITRVKHFEAYSRLYKELGAGLDPGHRR